MSSARMRGDRRSGAGFKIQRRIQNPKYELSPREGSQLQSSQGFKIQRESAGFKIQRAGGNAGF